MRRIFTSLLAIASVILFSNHSFGQCTEGVTINPGADIATFNGGPEDFVSLDGSFTYSGNNWHSSSVGTAPAVKTIVSKTYFVPNSMTTLQWGFNLHGNANVEGYAVSAYYFDEATGLTSLQAICSGGAISGTPPPGPPSDNYSGFSASTPSVLLGQYIRFRISFTISGANAHTINFDNFRTNADNSQITLPVRFTGFSVKSTTAGAKLTWSVDVEENVLGYEIEKSTDANNFSKIGFVAAEKSGTYTFTDVKTSPVPVYYRIRSVDIDGKFMYSTIAILNGDKSSLVMKAYPSPAVNDVTLWHETATSGSKITVTSIDGKVVKEIIPAKGSQQTRIALASAQPGMYVVRYENAYGEVNTVKIVKQ